VVNGCRFTGVHQKITRSPPACDFTETAAINGGPFHYSSMASAEYPPNTTLMIRLGHSVQEYLPTPPEGSMASPLPTGAHRTPPTSRFVRMYGTKCSTDYGYSLLEFEVR
jgi:hypothetical protein